MAELERIQEQQVIPFAWLISTSHFLHACLLSFADLFSAYMASKLRNHFLLCICVPGSYVVQYAWMLIAYKDM